MTPTDRFDARREQMLRELASDLADLVESGDMTADDANDWYARKADQWSAEGEWAASARPVSTCIEHGPGGTIRLSFQINVF